MQPIIHKKAPSGMERDAENLDFKYSIISNPIYLVGIILKKSIRLQSKFL
jgi:hypothetical protein